jgi:hypothetical protein
MSPAANLTVRNGASSTDRFGSLVCSHIALQYHYSRPLGDIADQ